MKTLRIWWLKRQARRAYARYQAAIGAYGCGANLAEQVSPRALAAKLRFNTTMDRLAKLDATAPAGRL